MPERAGHVAVGEAMIHVRQDHPNGCGIAVMAMLTDRTYDDVFAELTAEWPQDRDFTEQGTHHSIVEWFLGRHGYAWRTVYSAWKADPWPPEPFAPRHIAQVVQPSTNTHYVAVTENGTVLDPLSGILTTLHAWERINNVTGVWHVG